jgi:hypothetical protein
MVMAEMTTGIQPVPKRDWTTIGRVSMQMTDVKIMAP